MDNTRTRTADVTDAGAKIMWRVNKVNDAGADVLVSIHLNNGDDNNLLVFYEPGTKNEANSKKLGSSIIKEVTNLSGYTTDQTVKSSAGTGPGSLGLLKYFKGEAGVLIEVGGIKSEDNRTYINEHASDIGKQIAIGMYRYMYGKDPVEPKTEAPAAPEQAKPAVLIPAIKLEPDALKIVPLGGKPK